MSGAKLLGGVRGYRVFGVKVVGRKECGVKRKG